MLANAHKRLILKQSAVLVKPFDLPSLLFLYPFAFEFGELWDLKPGFLLEVESHRVDLVSQAQRRRAVVENIAKMGLTLITTEREKVSISQMTYIRADASLDGHFALEGGALVRVGHLVDLEVVADELDCVFQAVPEGGIATPVDILVVVHEESLGAADAVVATDVVRPPVLASEGTLHPVLELRHVELMRGQLLSHVLVVFLLVPCLPLAEIVHRGELILAIRLALLLALHHDVVVSDFTVSASCDIV